MNDQQFNKNFFEFFQMRTSSDKIMIGTKGGCRLKNKEKQLEKLNSLFECWLFS